MKKPTATLDEFVVTIKQDIEANAVAQELEQLKAAVRKHSHNPELLKMVGPDGFEKGQARQRLAIIKELMPRCEWHQKEPSFSAADTREKIDLLMIKQGAYEARYAGGMI